MSGETLGDILASALARTRPEFNFLSLRIGQTVKNDEGLTYEVIGHYRNTLVCGYDDATIVAFDRYGHPINSHVIGDLVAPQDDVIKALREYPVGSVAEMIFVNARTNSHKISTIKAIREITHCGLVEAKNAYESIYYSQLNWRI